MVSMVTIVGLGNPGEEYENTRHNVGWRILRLFIDTHALPSLSPSARYAGLISEGVVNGVDVGILFPTVYMNNSGGPVAKYVREKGSNVLIVVHDDVDLAMGDIKISYDRGAGGHNGVKSIIDVYGSSKFIRIRVGIAKKGFFGDVKRPKGDKLSTFVLGSLTKHEEKTLPEIAEDVDSALLHILKEGVEYAMQEMNVR